MIVLLLLVNLITVLFVLYLSAQHDGERKFCRGIIYAWLIYRMYSLRVNYSRLKAGAWFGSIEPRPATLRSRG